MSIRALVLAVGLLALLAGCDREGQLGELDTGANADAAEQENEELYILLIRIWAGVWGTGPLGGRYLTGALLVRFHMGEGVGSVVSNTCTQTV